MGGETSPRWGRLSPEELAGANFALKIVMGVASLDGQARRSVETMIEETEDLLVDALGLRMPEESCLS
jgi:hypothetical protein